MPISNNCNAVSHNIDMPISICKFPIKFLTLFILYRLLHFEEPIT